MPSCPAFSSAFLGAVGVALLVRRFIPARSGNGGSDPLRSPDGDSNPGGRRHRDCLLAGPVDTGLHLVKKPLHLTLDRLSDLHSPILLLHFGSRPVLVVSSPSAAEECLSKNDITFANRPGLPSLKHLSYNYTSLAAATYGPHWPNLRRITTVELLSTYRLQSLSSIRVSEVQAMARRLFRDWKASSAEGFAKVELKSRLFALSLNVLMRMITGKRYYGAEEEEAGLSEEARRFREVVEEGALLIGASNLGDFFPLLRWVDYQGVNRG